MDIQVQELLETIKRDGVEAAEKKARDILAAAEETAAGIIAEAEKKAANRLREQEQAVAQIQSSGKAALDQAGRDLILSVDKQLKKIFDSLVHETLKETYKSSVLEEAILTVVKNWAGKDEPGSLLLNENLEKNLTSTLKAQIGKAFKDGITIKPSPKVSGGFLVQEKDGSAYYDFTTEALAKALSVYLNPVLAQILAEVK